MTSNLPLIDIYVAMFYFLDPPFLGQNHNWNFLLESFFRLFTLNLLCINKCEIIGRIKKRAWLSVVLLCVKLVARATTYNRCYGDGTYLWFQLGGASFEQMFQSSFIYLQFSDLFIHLDKNNIEINIKGFLAFILHSSSEFHFLRIRLYSFFCLAYFCLCLVEFTPCIVRNCRLSVNITSAASGCRSLFSK